LSFLNFCSPISMRLWNSVSFWRITLKINIEGVA